MSTRRLLAVLAALAVAVSGCANLQDAGIFRESRNCDELRQRVRDVQADTFSSDVPDGAEVRARQLRCNLDDLLCLEHLWAEAARGNPGVTQEDVEACRDLAPADL